MDRQLTLLRYETIKLRMGESHSLLGIEDVDADAAGPDPCRQSLLEDVGDVGQESVVFQDVTNNLVDS